MTGVVIIVIALAFSASTAVALPTVPYEPGGNPCAGACSYEWALAETGAPAGIALPMTIPAGAISEWMSYARDGQPRVDTSPLQLVTDQAAVGYYFDRDGETFIMARIDQCLNWTVMRVPAQPVAVVPLAEGLIGRPLTIGSAVPMAGGTGAGVASSFGGLSYWPTGGGGSGGGDTDITNPTDPTDPVVPTPVPLPATGWLLAMAVLTLAARRRVA